MSDTPTTQRATAPQPAAQPAAQPASKSEPAPAPTPLIRQWIALEKGSCDLRLGEGALLQAPHILKTFVGLPQRLALFVEEGTDPAAIEEFVRGCTSSGFRVVTIPLEANLSYTLSSVELIAKHLLDHHITSGDLVGVCASQTGLGLVVAACRMWCGQTASFALPRDLVGLVSACGMPQAFSLEHSLRMLSVSAQFDLVIADTTLFDFDVTKPSTRQCLAFMVASSMAESDQVFKKLWDASFDIKEGSSFSFYEQLLEAIKLRGRMISSSAFSVRQASSYGVIVADAFARVLPSTTDAADCFAEALRFSARLSCAQAQLPVDDVLCQDELLDRFELGIGQVDVDPDQLFQAIQDACFLRSNKQMLPLPQAIGRVRSQGIDDQLLREHANAWSEAHRA